MTGAEARDVAGRVASSPVWEDGAWRPLPPLTADTTADVCVVGLGGSGLAAVTEARRRGLAVVGIDAGSIAGAAAGRNGGFLLAGTAAFHHDAVSELGRERAAAVYRETLAEVARIRAATPGAVRLTGSLRIAADAEELADCEAQYRQMVSDGLPVERYRGPEGEGLLFPEDCAFQPLARCRELARSALAAGARLYEGTAALDFGGGRVVTTGGTVSCAAVIVAVDGGLDALVPELSELVRTARLQMLATAPLGRVVFPRPVYRRYGFEYYQQLPDGRLALGGFRDRAGDSEWTTESAPGEAVQAMLERFLRGDLGVEAEITHRWAASVGYSLRSVLPVFARLRGAVVIGGYSGTGNVIGSLLGRAAVSVASSEPSPIAELFASTSVAAVGEGPVRGS